MATSLQRISLKAEEDRQYAAAVGAQKMLYELLLPRKMDHEAAKESRLGWGIDERHGGVRLTRQIAAGKQHKNPRQTVQLGISWNLAHSGDIFLVVCQIRERMENG